MNQERIKKYVENEEAGNKFNNVMINCLYLILLELQEKRDGREKRKAAKGDR